MLMNNLQRTSDKCFAERVLKFFFSALILVFLAACNSTAEKSNDGAPQINQASDKAALAAQQQRRAKQQILNYAKADKDYQALVTALTKGKENGTPTHADFDTIIRVYPLTSKYSPYANVEQTQKLVAFESMEQENWNACLQATNRILAENYTSLTGHYGAMVCHSEAGQQSMGEYHNMMLDGFMGAIWRSGDGESPATAFYITSSNDLYAFVQLNGFMATGQSLVYYEQRPIDAINVQDPQTKQETTWYFDVTAQFRRGIFDGMESR